MLYMAHFSYDQSGEVQKHGYFTCLIDSDTMEGSLDAFRVLLKKLHDAGEAFQEPTTIYLDDLVRIKKVPPDGFLAHLLAREGELPSSTSTSLPGVGNEYCEAFGVAPEKSEDTEVVIDPFLSFE
jgi:hypothetical protein